MWLKNGAPSWLMAKLEAQSRRRGSRAALPLRLFNPLTHRVEGLDSRATMKGQGGRGWPADRNRPGAGSPTYYRFPWPDVPPGSRIEGAFYGKRE